LGERDRSSAGEGELDSVRLRTYALIDVVPTALILAFAMPDSCPGKHAMAALRRFACTAATELTEQAGPP
jgi:hypothetical protein